MTTPLAINLKVVKGNYDGIDEQLIYKANDPRFYDFFGTSYNITLDPENIDEENGIFANREDAIDYHLNTAPDIQNFVSAINQEDLGFDFVIGELTGVAPAEYVRITPLELRMTQAEADIVSLQSWRADLSDNIAAVSSTPTNNTVTLLGLQVPTQSSYDAVCNCVAEIKTKVNAILNMAEERELMAA